MPKHGSGGGARTHGQRINSPSLCQLSYPGRSLHLIGGTPVGPKVGTQLQIWPWLRLDRRRIEVSCCCEGAANGPMYATQFDGFSL